MVRREINTRRQEMLSLDVDTEVVVEVAIHFPVYLRERAMNDREALKSSCRACVLGRHAVSGNGSVLCWLLERGRLYRPVSRSDGESIIELL